MQQLLQSNFKIFSSSQEETTYPLANVSQYPFTSALATTNVLSVSGFTYIGHFVYVE